MSAKGKVLIVGSGFGGLACAIGLAGRGYQVTILERKDRVGGKLQRIVIDGYRFDCGPNTIELPFVFRNVFRSVGRRMEDYVSLIPLEPRSRNIFTDGSVVDMTGDVEAMQHQIDTYSPVDALHYPAFLQESRMMFQSIKGRLISRLPIGNREKWNVGMLREMLSVVPLFRRSLNRELRHFFAHPNSLALFGRYAPRVGSSPFLAPSMYGMMHSCEIDHGTYSVRGGTYALVEALQELAKELGVEIKTGVEARQIRVQGGRACGIETNDGYYEAPLIVINGDLLSTTQKLLSEALRPSLNDRRIASMEPSLSAFVQLAGVPSLYDRLLHHTVFFSDRYEEEFTEIFDQRKPPSKPSVYICNSSYSEKGAAPEGHSNLFIMTYAPYLSDSWDWEEQRESYAENVLSTLRGYGLQGINKNHVLSTYSPDQLARDTGAYRGGIYGIATHNPRQILRRPSNRSRDVRGLWYVGSSTYPGGGVPYVTLSGHLVAGYIAHEMG
ncbi:MAG TPA: phytoene desaturase family protein [Paenibacillus sp.]